jgi:polyisoprenoid-binding protein YceI
MFKKPWTVLGIVAFVALTGSACSDPTADKPAAEVSEATPDAAPVAGEAVKMVLAPESAVEFTGYKVTGSHDGGFKSFTGHVSLVDADPTRSSVEIEIDTTSLWSDNERLTGHLKSPDFFDVENHPTARFSSTSIEAAADGGYTITGNLDLHGITKSISFPAQITADTNRVAAEATFKIKRFEFDIAFTGKKDDLIDDDVVIRLNLIATRAAENDAEA